MSPLERSRCGAVFAPSPGIIGPQQPRGDAAPGAPGFRDLDHHLRLGRASSARASLTAYCRARSPGDQASAPGEAEQDVDIGGPRADALERGQALREWPFSGACDRASRSSRRSRSPRRDALSVAILTRDRPAARNLGLRHGKERRRAEGLHARFKSPPDRVGAGNGELLAHDYAGKPLETGRSAAQRGIAGKGMHPRHVCAGADQRGHPLLQIFFGSDPAHGQ